MRQLRPGAYRWVRRCHLSAFQRYVRMEDGSVRELLSSSGTTQGDPLGPTEHNFAIEELLKELGSMVGAGILYYLDDDGTVVGPVEELARMAELLTEPAGPQEFQMRTGMQLNQHQQVCGVDTCVRLPGR
ncbi:MAG: hypothetical protein SGPRY_010181 [Prymnesium sp.]